MRDTGVNRSQDREASSFQLPAARKTVKPGRRTPEAGPKTKQVQRRDQRIAGRSWIVIAAEEGTTSVIREEVF